MLFLLNINFNLRLWCLKHWVKTLEVRVDLGKSFFFLSYSSSSSSKIHTNLRDNTRQGDKFQIPCFGIILNVMTINIHPCRSSSITLKDFIAQTLINFSYGWIIRNWFKFRIKLTIQNISKTYKNHSRFEILAMTWLLQQEYSTYISRATNNSENFNIQNTYNPPIKNF